MTGIARSTAQLDKSLKFVCNRLHTFGLKNWFVGYGTLLGIVRDGHCIDGDDDLDIVIDVKEINQVRELVSALWFSHDYETLIDKKGKFLQIANKESQIDFYFCKVDRRGNFFDRHEKVTWTKCFNNKGSLPTIDWQGIRLNVPQDSRKKVRNRYGKRWNKRIRKNEPGGEGYRSVLFL